MSIKGQITITVEFSYNVRQGTSITKYSARCKIRTLDDINIQLVIHKANQMQDHGFR